jgi:hypothetical protein
MSPPGNIAIFMACGKDNRNVVWESERVEEEENVSGAREQLK